MRKRRWQKPKLIVLLRGVSSAENVLSYCKLISGAEGPTAGWPDSCREAFEGCGTICQDMAETS
jgi:hypothetical protein